MIDRRQIPKEAHYDWMRVKNDQEEMLRLSQSVQSGCDQEGNGEIFKKKKKKKKKKRRKCWI